MKTQNQKDENVSLDRKKQYVEDYFGNLPTAEINAIYKNGKFYDYDTNEEVTFKDASLVKIKSLLASIVDKDFERHISEIRKEILPVNSYLFMKLDMKNGSFYILHIQLHDPLFMLKKGNKKSVCEPCPCTVTEISDYYSKQNIEFNPIEANSLNQIFFLASLQFRKDYRSHTANIYNCTFLKDGRKLELLRF